ncbi:MAG: AAA family ATPase [Synergistaceae bacterium]|jgi:uncharacterized protein YhaN|nr:AAA family ATPase [Synergistaceae bacterium]
MRFSEFAMESFGRLRRVEGRFAPRLTVVWGPNESGKTTLLNFIRRVLFYRKVPKGEQQSLKLFAPGYLAVCMDDGRNLRLEIDGRRHLVGDGASMTPLRENLLPVGPGVFERIFAIGLDDLQSPRRLDDEEVQDRFFSAGAGLGTMSLPGFLARMEKLERELYAPGGPNAGVRLNAILTEIQNNEVEIETWKRENLRYLEIERELEAKRAAVTATRQKLVEIRQRLAFLGVITRARPVWLEIRELEGVLSAKPMVGRTIPGGGRERLDAFLKRAEELREEIGSCKQKENQERLRCAQMENSPLMSLLAYRQELEALEEKAEEIRGAVAEIPLLSEEIKEKEALLKRGLHDFAPRWSEANLAEADLSLASARKAKQYEENIEALRERRNALLRGLEANMERRKSLEAELALTRDRMEEPEVVPEVFQKRRDLFLAIRQDLLHNDAVCQEIRGEKMRADILEEELRDDARPPVSRRQWIAGFLLAFLVFLAGVSAMVGFLEPRLQPWNFYGASFCAIFALGPLAMILMERREYARELDRWDERYERRRRGFDAINAGIEELRREMQTVTVSIEENAISLGVRVPSSLEALDAVSEALEGERAHMRRRAELGGEEARLTQATAEIDVQRRNLESDMKALDDESEERRRERQIWLRHGGFDPELAPEDFAPFLTWAESAQKELILIGNLRNRLRLRKEFTASIDDSARSISKKLGLDLDGETLPVVLRSLKEALDLKTRIDETARTLRRLENERKRPEEELETVEGNILALYADAGARDEDEFRSLAEECEACAVLTARLEELRRLLKGILGGGAEGVAHEEEFVRDAAGQAMEMEQLRFAADDGERTLDGLCTACGAMEAQLSSMASNERLFELRQKNEILRFEGRKLFRCWLSIVLTRYFTEKARDRHEKNRQPDVARRAEGILADILASGTPERWSILFGADGEPDAGPGEDASRMEENEALLNRGTGMRLKERHWSSGLADQVWLSLRLAMAARQAEISESIPVVLDDILVRFDEGRQRRTMEALWKLSGRLQVILFTCHQATAGMFRSQLGDEADFALIELSADRDGEKEKAPAPKAGRQARARR